MKINELKITYCCTAPYITVCFIKFCFGIPSPERILHKNHLFEKAYSATNYFSVVSSLKSLRYNYSTLPESYRLLKDTLICSGSQLLS